MFDGGRAREEGRLGGLRRHRESLVVPVKRTDYLAGVKLPAGKLTLSIISYHIRESLVGMIPGNPNRESRRYRG